MVTADRPVYEPNIPETFMEGTFVEDKQSGYYINHLFDVKGVTKSKKCKRHKHISHGLASLKGVEHV